MSMLSDKVPQCRTRPPADERPPHVAKLSAQRRVDQAGLAVESGPVGSRRRGPLSPRPRSTRRSFRSALDRDLLTGAVSARASIERCRPRAAGAVVSLTIRPHPAGRGSPACAAVWRLEAQPIRARMFAEDGRAAGALAAHEDGSRRGREPLQLLECRESGECRVLRRGCRGCRRGRRRVAAAFAGGRPADHQAPHRVGGGGNHHLGRVGERREGEDPRLLAARHRATGFSLLSAPEPDGHRAAAAVEDPAHVVAGRDLDHRLLGARARCGAGEILALRDRDLAAIRAQARREIRISTTTRRPAGPGSRRRPAEVRRSSMPPHQRRGSRLRRRPRAGDRDAQSGPG